MCYPGASFPQGEVTPPHLVRPSRRARLNGIRSKFWVKDKVKAIDAAVHETEAVAARLSIKLG